MAHVSLYRKYRPGSFAEVVGQDHVTTTLARAVDGGTWHHAYLFTGPRGTGKTSTARLLAMALNASAGPTSTPDPDDPIVAAIRDGRCPDVIEIDAASNNGVDDVRDLWDRVAFAPAQARIKVYIVDECHMLSNAAWNAFLKTIEEPPDHVVFVFATTEPHKVLPTVLSRTQRFDLRRIPATQLADHCRHIAELEGFVFEGDALASIVRAGDGSARDTLSVLDQVVAFTGPVITPEGVAEVLGSVPATLLDRMAGLLVDGDVAGLLQLVAQVADGGTDLRQFATDAVDHLRSLLLLSAAPDAGLVDATPDRLAELTAQAARTGPADLLRAVELLNDAQPKMRRGSTQLALEVALAKAALPAAGGDVDALAARLARLEGQMAGGGARPDPGPAPAATGSPAPADPPSPAPAAEAPVAEAPVVEAPVAEGPVAEAPVAEDPVVEAPVAEGPVAETPAAGSPAAAATAPAPAPAPDPPSPGEGDHLAQVVAAWEAVVTTLGASSKRLQAIVGEGRPVAVADGALVLQFRFDFHAKQVEDPTVAQAVAGVVEQVVGTRYRIRAVVGDDDPPSPAAVVVDDEESAVINHEADEAAGTLPDDDAAHDAAVRTLTDHLGAAVIRDTGGDGGRPPVA